MLIIAIVFLYVYLANNLIKHLTKNSNLYIIYLVDMLEFMII
jgi:hypothetical protein